MRVGLAFHHSQCHLLYFQPTREKLQAASADGRYFPKRIDANFFGGLQRTALIRIDRLCMLLSGARRFSLASLSVLLLRIATLSFSTL